MRKSARKRLSDVEARLAKIEEPPKITPWRTDRYEPKISARIAWTQPFDGTASGRLELCVDGTPFLVSDPLPVSDLRPEGTQRTYGYYDGDAYAIAVLARTLRSTEAPS